MWTHVAAELAPRLVFISLLSHFDSLVAVGRSNDPRCSVLKDPHGENHELSSILVNNYPIRDFHDYYTVLSLREPEGTQNLRKRNHH